MAASQPDHHFFLLMDEITATKKMGSKLLFPGHLCLFCWAILCFSICCQLQLSKQAPALHLMVYAGSPSHVCIWGEERLHTWFAELSEAFAHPLNGKLSAGLQQHLQAKEEANSREACG